MRRSATGGPGADQRELHAALIFQSRRRVCACVLIEKLHRRGGGHITYKHTHAQFKEQEHMMINHCTLHTLQFRRWVFKVRKWPKFHRPFQISILRVEFNRCAPSLGMVKIVCFIGEKVDFFFACFLLNLVVFLVAFLSKKSPFSLLFGLTIFDFIFI